jgi:hypothetical protein
MLSHSFKPIALILVIAIPGLVYFFTQAPAVSYIDSGELAVTCYTLGIAHPTGYPLYTQLGRIFCLLPIKDIIFRLNFLSCIIVSFSSLFLFLTLMILGGLILKKEKEGLVTGGSFIAALIFAFTPTLWSQATSNEVYGLNIFFCSLIIFLILKWHYHPQKNPKLLYLFVFLYGLSFGNHMSMVLLSPALIFIILKTEGRSIFEKKKIITFAFLFLLGISIYLYLPIRSSQNPIFNWGNPKSFSSFFRHVSGWQYQVWMFSSSPDQLLKNFSNYLKILHLQFPFYILPLTLWGAFKFIKREKMLLVFLLLILILDVFYGINYSIPDIDPYFLKSFLVLSIFTAIGIFSCLQLLQNLLTSSKQNLAFKKVSFNAIIILLALIPLIFCVKNFYYQNQKENYFAYDYTKNILRSAKKDAIILTNVWDHYSPWLYLRFVENLRPDVRFLETRLSLRAWYFDYIRNLYPEIYHSSEKEIEEYIEQVYLFENNKPFSPEEIEGKYVHMFRNILSKNYEKFPLYQDLLPLSTDKNLKTMISSLFAEIPEGLVHRLRKERKYFPCDFPKLELRGVKDQEVYKDGRTLANLYRYPMMIENRILYLQYFKEDYLANQLEKRYAEILKDKID